MKRFCRRCADALSRACSPALLQQRLRCTALRPGARRAPPATRQKGAQKVAMCQGCHGIVGWRTAFPEVYRVPKLSGQNPQYIVAALKEYKSGDRGHPTMKAIAASLTDADMADIAAYYSQAPLTTASK